MWTSKYPCANFKDVDIKQMPLFEEMFNVNVNVYSLQPDNSATMPDQVQTVLSKLCSNENTYIQNISMIRIENSNITIYHQHQKLLMNSLIEDGDFVFNLSSVYVTVTVFKHNMLRGKSPNTPPLLIGPVYLHWNAKLETYKDFLHHVETYFLTDENVRTRFVIVTDKERALMRAVEDTLPSCKLILCHRHVRESIARGLEKLILINKQKNNLTSNFFIFVVMYMYS